MFSNKIIKRLLRPSLFSQRSALRFSTVTDSQHTESITSVDQVEYTNEITKHRPILPLYDLEPLTNDCFIASTATIVGEVHINLYATVWNNAVIRGEINEVVIGGYASIGDNTVIQTVASLPTGLSAR